jgi:hypothetical protein
MRRKTWRYSRPLRCVLYLCLLLFLVWLLRLTLGTPAADAVTVLRRAEKANLRPAGELVCILEQEGPFSTAVTWRGGELYTYTLVRHSADGKYTKRYGHALPCRDTAEDGRDWCTGPESSGYRLVDYHSVLASDFYVLVKQADPAVKRARLTIRGEAEGVTSVWESEAERTDPRCLAFRMEQRDGGDRIRQIWYALHAGRYYGEPVAARAEAVFYDAEGNEVSRMAFDMVEGSIYGEGSGDDGA